MVNDFSAFFRMGKKTMIARHATKTFAGNSIEELRALKKVRGPLFGYVSYDLGYELHGIRPKTRDALGIPLFCFKQYDDLRIVEDLSFPTCKRQTPSWKSSITFKEYSKGFREIQKGILDGEFYQLNYTYAFEARSTMNPRDLFLSYLESNPAPCAGYFETDDAAILSLSPERFLSINGSKMNTTPIKGTRPRGNTPSEDRKMREELLRNEKEKAELNMITDLLRNDLGQTAVPGSVRVTKQRELQKNPTVWHTYSEIQAKLDKKYSPIDAFIAMFPGGSITGCPKRAAMLEIDRLEQNRRGPYTGCFIFLDGGRLESSILIRTIVSKRGKLSLGVGGGIVADSDVTKEYEETKRKAASFVEKWTR